MKRISIALLMLVALVLAACTDSQGGSPAASTAAEESAAAGESQAAQESEGAEESAAGDDGTGALPSFEVPDSAPELAALLPDEIGGQEAFKLSMSGAEMMEGTGEEGVEVDQEFIEFLNRLGASPDDISVAMAFGLTEEATAGIFAFRVQGASADQLESEFRAVMEEEASEPLEWADTNVAGKSVMAAEDPDNPGNTMYLYTTGDIIFIVTAVSEEGAAELLEPLP